MGRVDPIYIDAIIYIYILYIYTTVDGSEIRLTS